MGLVLLISCSLASIGRCGCDLLQQQEQEKRPNEVPPVLRADRIRDHRAVEQVIQCVLAGSQSPSDAARPASVSRTSLVRRPESGHSGAADARLVRGDYRTRPAFDESVDFIPMHLGRGRGQRCVAQIVPDKLSTQPLVQAREWHACDASSASTQLGVCPRALGWNPEQRLPLPGRIASLLTTDAPD